MRTVIVMSPEEYTRNVWDFFKYLVASFAMFCYAPFVLFLAFVVLGLGLIAYPVNRIGPRTGLRLARILVRHVGASWKVLTK